MGPLAIDPVMQKDSGDCAIAALSMIIGRPYREVSEVALKLIKTPFHSTGVYTVDMKRIAKHFGVKLKTVRSKAELDNETGILQVEKPYGYHAVVLFQGVVYNPADGLLWDLDAYLASTESTFHLLLKP